VATSARSFVNGHRGDFGQVSRGRGQVHVTITDGLHAIPRQVHQTGYRRKCHLPAQRQHERFKQQRKAIQLAHPVGFCQPHRAVRQAHARHPDLEIAFVLKEVQVPQPLDLRVVHRVLAGDAGVGEAAAGNKVHGNRELPFGRVKVDALHVPRGIDSQGGFKELIRHVRFVSQGWLPHSAATSPASAYVFASPGLRPHLTRHFTHSRFERGKFVHCGLPIDRDILHCRPSAHARAARSERMRII
jgi:hypothetical protein